MKALEKLRSKLIAIKASPEKISKGYALGVFLGTTPLIGTKVFIALGITSFLKWNKIASVIGVYHINLFTAPAFYSAAFFTGKLVTRTTVNIEMPAELSFRAVFGLFTQSPDILIAITIGGFILGLPMTLLAYYFSYSILKGSLR